MINGAVAESDANYLAGLKLCLEKVRRNGWILRARRFEGNVECRWSKFTADRVNDTKAPLTYRNIHGQTVHTSGMNEL